METKNMPQKSIAVEVFSEIKTLTPPERKKVISAVKKLFEFRKKASENEKIEILTFSPYPINSEMIEFQPDVVGTLIDACTRLNLDTEINYKRQMGLGYYELVANNQQRRN